MNIDSNLRLELIRAKVENTTNLAKSNLINLFALAYIVKKNNLSASDFDEILMNPKELESFEEFEYNVGIARSKINSVEIEERKNLIFKEIDELLLIEHKAISVVNETITIVESDIAIPKGVKIADRYYVVRIDDLKEEYKTINVLDYILEYYGHRKIKVNMFEMFVKEAIEKSINDYSFKRKFSRHFAMHLFNESDPRWFFENRIKEVVKGYILNQIDGIKLEVLESELI